MSFDSTYSTYSLILQPHVQIGALLLSCMPGEPIRDHPLLWHYRLARSSPFVSKEHCSNINTATTSAVLLAVEELAMLFQQSSPATDYAAEWIIDNSVVRSVGDRVCFCYTNNRSFTVTQEIRPKNNSMFVSLYSKGKTLKSFPIKFNVLVYQTQRS